MRPRENKRSQTTTTARITVTTTTTNYDYEASSFQKTNLTRHLVLQPIYTTSGRPISSSTANMTHNLGPGSACGCPVDYYAQQMTPVTCPDCAGSPRLYVFFGFYVLLHLASNSILVLPSASAVAARDLSGVCANTNRPPCKWPTPKNQRHATRELGVTTETPEARRKGLDPPDLEPSELLVKHHFGVYDVVGS